MSPDMQVILLFLKSPPLIFNNLISSWKLSYRRRRLRWSCLEVLPQLDFGQVTSWLCPTPSSWWCRRHPCRTARRPPWTPRFALPSVDQPCQWISVPVKWIILEWSIGPWMYSSRSHVTINRLPFWIWSDFQACVFHFPSKPLLTNTEEPLPTCHYQWFYWPQWI